jgi:hypothetical protein
MGNVPRRVKFPYKTGAAGNTVATYSSQSYDGANTNLKAVEKMKRIDFTKGKVLVGEVNEGGNCQTAS